jgi:hypothetical protein
MRIIIIAVDDDAHVCRTCAHAIAATRFMTRDRAVIFSAFCARFHTVD